MKGRHVILQKPLFLCLLLAGLIGGILLLSVTRTMPDRPTLTSFRTPKSSSNTQSLSPDLHLKALLHYATSAVVPQQSFAEIGISFDVLQKRSPCNFLVFGLGHDSLMWSAFNAGGNTVFLEEDPQWVKTVLQKAPDLRAHTVRYRTKLSQADELYSWYKTEPECSPEKSELRGNNKCKLALTGLPDEIYDTEWDLIMIDAPRGYFAEAPGRMGAIYSAAVMARNRKGPGITDVFLHDVERKVEKMYAEEFLCKKYLVNATGRLWHFAIPPANNTTGGGKSSSFC
ncbi:probable methyltransferase At1g27930 [Impatiens glandulifera]|uniref:probable methyltransferase At1g27930 n=1 Tax=Impatiens glandulifera TaxID=253017 RepID=UPI001FB0D09D|nr:probable methyltransferase At1g27930 [Impatiens glandulifera]